MMEVNHSTKQAATNGSSTDALIINSNSNVVSEEIVTQLQEQFGDSKQIYILNTNNNGGSIQYLVVDKEVDINVLLQDPSILQASASASAATATSQPQPQQQQQSQINQVLFNQQKAVAGVTNLPKSISQQQQQSLQNNDVEESIARVQEPPPKRKKVEYRPIDPTGKPSTYHEEFMRFLLQGVHQEESLTSSPTDSSPPIKKHPRDKIYLNFFANSPLAMTNSTSPLPPSAVASANQLPPLSNGASSSTIAASHHVDKENYYNSSRRENLAPLNSYEYRNSYKDVYDNQGVRVNPAIIKSLAAAASVQTTATSTTMATASTSLGPKSSIMITKRDNTGSDTTTATTATNILADHTYKSGSSQSMGTKKTQNDTPSEAQNHEANFDITDTSTGGAKTSIAATVSLLEQVTFSPGEFLIHKATFSGDPNNYDIWCVLDDAYLQKYEPVMLLTGERCHQSADVLAQYTQNKDDFLVVKVEEKGKTESDNIVVAVLSEYEPKNNVKIAAQLNLAIPNL